MVTAAARVILGGISFSSLEAQFLFAGLRQGLGVRRIREQFRVGFGRGLPSPAFTAARRTLSDSERAGIRISRLKPGQRLSLVNIPKVEVQRASGRFVITAQYRLRVAGTDTVLERTVRFATDGRPSLDELNRRGKEIIDSGVEAGESDLEVIGLLGIGVVEQITV